MIYLCSALCTLKPKNLKKIPKNLGFFQPCSPDVKFPEISMTVHGTQHVKCIEVIKNRLSVTYIMPVLVLNTCMDTNMQFTFK